MHRYMHTHATNTHAHAVVCFLSCSTPKVGGFSPAFRPVGGGGDNSLPPAPEQKEPEKQESEKPSDVKGEKRSAESTNSTASKPPSKKSAPVDMFDMFNEEKEEEKEKSLEAASKKRAPVDMFDMFDEEKEEEKEKSLEAASKKSVPADMFDMFAEEGKKEQGLEHQFPKEVDEEAIGTEVKKASLPPEEGSGEGGMNNPTSSKSANFLLPRFARKSRPIVREPKEKLAPVDKGVPKEMTVEETQAEVWKVAEMLHQRHSTNTKSAGYLARCRERIERYKKAQVFVPGGTVLLDTSKFAAEVEQKRKNLKPGEDFDVPQPKAEKVIDDINEEDLESLRGVIMGFGKANEKPKRVQPKLKLTVSNVFNQDSSSEEEGEGGVVGALSASGVASTWTHKKPSSLPK